MSILINGQAESAIAVTDRGLQYGDGLFETIAVINGQCPLWDRHIRRLKQGCDRLSLTCPDEYLLLEEATKLVSNNRQAVLKIIITRGTGERGYAYPLKSHTTRIMMCSAWPEFPVENTQTGIKVHLCATRLAQQPLLAGIKHLNRLEQVLARNEWQDKTIAEGILLDQDDNVIEGTVSNLFLVNNGRLQTPDLSLSGVAGVMRDLILEQASGLGIKTEIRKIRLEDVHRADEVFVCNSVIGIWPVVDIQNQLINVGDVTRELQRAVSCFYV
ncbi:MAG: aminodeoxychorismate lyase [Gammaproteobacteria bacterium]|nr:aminodeoxychorismate lyase [Gammaproteobacteria bacterium]